MKKCIFLVVLALLAASCSVQNLDEETGFVNFELSGGAKIMALGVDDGPRYLMMTIKRHCGRVVYEREIVELYRMGEGYISEPLELMVGYFKLLEFMVLDGERQIIYVTPIEGSSKAHLVYDPLPIGFQVNRYETTTVNPEILYAHGAAPEDFGYKGVSFNVVETIPFKVRVYEWTEMGKELTEAEFTVRSGEEILYTGRLDAGINEVEVRDRYGIYNLTAEKEGFDAYEASFTDEKLKGFIESPLDIYFGEPITLSISGQVTYDTGSGIIGFPGVVMLLNGSAYDTVITDAEGRFTFSALFAGEYYTVTPNKPGYTFSADWSGIPTEDVTNANFFTTSGSAYTISGNVWGDRSPAGIAVTLNTAPPLITYTDEMGSYTTAPVPNGTYTLTPSSSSGNMGFSPAEMIVEVQGYDLFVESFNFFSSYSISGTVYYYGSESGWVYINVIDQWDWPSGIGTSIQIPGSGSWPFTIRGVRPGTYTLSARMDNLGLGESHGSNPTGTSTTFEVIESDVTNKDITLSDPPPVAPEAPAIMAVFPSNESAWVVYEAPTDENEEEIAKYYNVYWGYDELVSKNNKQDVLQFPPNWIDVFVATGLPDGKSLYFVMTSVTNGGESAESAPFGPVTIGASTGGYTLSGDITLGQDATGPLFVLAYSETGAFATYIDSPVSPQGYSIEGLTAGDYLYAVLIDMNNNGVLDVGDYYTGFESEHILTVDGDESRDHVFSPLPNAFTRVSTSHEVDSWGDNYGLRFTVEEGLKSWVAASISGPYIPGTIDFNRFSHDWGFSYYLGSTRPKIGNSYTFTVMYADSTIEVVERSVTAVIDSFPTPIAPIGYVAGATHPTFYWNPPLSPPAEYEYTLFVWEDMGGDVWYTSEISSDEISVEFNDDGWASQDPLNEWSTYNWRVGVRDSNGNEGSSSPVSFTPTP